MTTLSLVQVLKRETGGLKQIETADEVYRKRLDFGVEKDDIIAYCKFCDRLVNMSKHKSVFCEGVPGAMHPRMLLVTKARAPKSVRSR